MSFLMMLAACGGGTLKSKPFTANESWPVPATTSMLVSAVGKGANGTAGYYETTTTTTPIKRETIYYTYLHRRDGGPDDVVTSVGNYWNGDPNLTVKPANYCDPYKADPDSAVYHGYTKCRLYSQSGGETTTTTTWVAPTTGASSSGFGKTFQGGAGGPASMTTFNNVPVTPGASYNIVVPSGGSITITYIE